MTLTIIFIVAMILIFLSVGLIVYLAIRNSAKKNKQYEIFAKQYHYYFDKAQGNIYYREYSKGKTESTTSIELGKNPYVGKYANFTNYPFGRGSDMRVSFVISGAYNDTEFRAFTYTFKGNELRATGPGGVFSIVMIGCSNIHIAKLPSKIFYENGMLCEYIEENLNVNTIHDRINRLIYIKNGEQQYDDKKISK